MPTNFISSIKSKSNWFSHLFCLFPKTERISYKHCSLCHSNNPITPNKTTCYGNRPKFKEQKLPKLYQQNRIPIMSSKWTCKNLSKMDKKGLQCTYRFSFCHLLPRTLDSNPIQSSSKSHHHIIREGIPRWLYLTSWSTERSDESIVMYHHRWNQQINSTCFQCFGNNMTLFFASIFQVLPTMYRS